MKNSSNIHMLAFVFCACITANPLSQTALAADPSSMESLSDFASKNDRTTFASADEAVAAFKQALQADDADKLSMLVGLEPSKVKADAQAMEAFAQIRDAAEKKLNVRDTADFKILDIGDKLWPFPFPIVKASDGKWSFDTDAGFEEIINRRIGENELQAIATMRAYVEAQREYASEDRDGDGVLEYARKIISSEGETDGLYWPANAEIGPSPAGEAIVDGTILDRSRAGEGYFGYHHRILERQGDNIAGGKFDYVINGNMVAGFALIAWPVRYGETGVHTFEINMNGIIYQADLGETTDKIAASIKQFNPSDTWQIADD